MAGILCLVATAVGKLDDLPHRVAATFGAHSGGRELRPLH